MTTYKIEVHANTEEEANPGQEEYLAEDFLYRIMGGSFPVTVTVTNTDAGTVTVFDSRELDIYD